MMETLLEKLNYNNILIYYPENSYVFLCISLPGMYFGIKK